MHRERNESQKEHNVGFLRWTDKQWIWRWCWTFLQMFQQLTNRCTPGNCRGDGVNEGEGACRGDGYGEEQKSKRKRVRSRGWAVCGQRGPARWGWWRGHMQVCIFLTCEVYTQSSLLPPYLFSLTMYWIPPSINPSSSPTHSLYSYLLLVPEKKNRAAIM